MPQISPRSVTQQILYESVHSFLMLENIEGVTILIEVEDPIEIMMLQSSHNRLILF